jgi:uncharacterized protein YbbC (DUF1343 family)
MVVTGLDIIKDSKSIDRQYSGGVAYLAHGASVDGKLEHGIAIMKKRFGNRFIKVFSPQHGLVGDVQDNMIESDHFHHPYFGLPVYSLYSETRKPTTEMLQDLQVVFVDLQDVGTRIYTYIYTMTYMMEACADLGIKVVVLDRPNPIGGLEVEGNILEPEFTSFVGRHPLPMRHGMTIGEIALMAKTHWGIDCQLEVIKMRGWDRAMYFEQTGLPWVLPSPNLATAEAALVFPGSVLFEGTNVSEGRGTTRSLEIIGHPGIEPYGWLETLEDEFAGFELEGFRLRPLNFIPTFQKHQGKVCGGYQIHVVDKQKFKPWRLGQFLCRAFYRDLAAFSWKQPPYEYEYTNMPIDILNGSDRLRLWVEGNGDLSQLVEIEQHGAADFQETRSAILQY